MKMANSEGLPAVVVSQLILLVASAAFAATIIVSRGKRSDDLLNAGGTPKVTSASFHCRSRLT
jgi:hypothetical protein